MASFMLRSVVPKLQWAASSLKPRSMNSRLLMSTNSGPMSASAVNAGREVRDSASNLQNQLGNAMKQGNKEAKRTAEDVKDKAASTAEQVGQKTKEVASKVTEKAQDLGEKTKQTVQGAWEAAKETTQKIKETVVGKAEDVKEAVKEEAENVKRNINSKM
ncbi:Uncharacterized protein EJ110_NYTH11896 [Nymphaea thermarum]|nr:Uncharacterized protein EJ110_NYTH11896 [Nymphaea thermarum]